MGFPHGPNQSSATSTNLKKKKNLFCGLKNCFFKHLPCKNNIQHGLKQTTQCQSGGLWIVRSIYLQSTEKIIMVLKIGFTF